MRPTRHRLILTCALAALALSVALSATGSASATARGRRQHIRAVYGVTLDTTARLPDTVRALSRLPRRPTVRIYFDVHRSAGSYRAAVTRVGRVGMVMGELLDSSDERAISVAATRRRARSYVRTLGRHVAIWEIGNEVNGNWLGRPRAVAGRVLAAFDAVRAARGATALTLYANDFGPNHCGDGREELTPVEFTRRWIPAAVRHGVDQVLLSYYPTQCGGRLPKVGAVARQLRALHRLYPHAKLGFGEVGLPNPVTRRSLPLARRIMRWAYSLDPHLPYYIGGYFWWYAAEDALHPGAPMWSALHQGFLDEARALG